MSAIEGACIVGTEGTESSVHYSERMSAIEGACVVGLRAVSTIVRECLLLRAYPLYRRR